MGALTASSTTRENIGSMNVLIVKFTSVDNGDTWASSHNHVIAHWAKSDDVGTAYNSTSSHGIATSDNGAGTITFSCNESDHAVTLFMWVKD